MGRTKIMIDPIELLGQYKSGKTLKELSDKFLVTGEAIRKVLKSTGEYARNFKPHKPIRPSFEDRFWGNIDKSGACWEWKKHKHKNGYGGLRYKGKQEYSHRVAWIISFGDIPDGLYVCHRCDNPSCCNPSHLWLGTPADNMHDRDAKGRGGDTSWRKNKAIVNQ